MVEEDRTLAYIPVFLEDKINQPSLTRLGAAGNAALSRDPVKADAKSPQVAAGAAPRI
jgi:hypothetical protein